MSSTRTVLVPKRKLPAFEDALAWRGATTLSSESKSEQQPAIPKLLNLKRDELEEKNIAYLAFTSPSFVFP